MMDLLSTANRKATPAWLGYLLLVLALLEIAPPAYAEPKSGAESRFSSNHATAATTIAAHKLFMRGRQLMVLGQIDVACQMFAASLVTEPQNGTRLHLARCHQLQGKTATAYREYGQVAIIAHQRDNQPRKAEAVRRRRELRPALSRLIIQLSRPHTNVSVTVDNKTLPFIDYGVPRPIDPGEHTIVAKGPDDWLFRHTVNVGASADRKRVIIPVPAAPVPLIKEAEPDYTVPATLFASSAACGIASAALLGLYVDQATNGNATSSDARITIGFGAGLALASVISLGIAIEVISADDDSGAAARRSAPQLSVAATPAGLAVGAAIPF